MVMSLDNLNAQQQGSIELTDRHRMNNHHHHHHSHHGRLNQRNNKVKVGPSISNGGSTRKSFKDFQEKDNTMSYFLLEAAKNGNPDELENLLRDGGNPNIIDTLGRSPLHLVTSIECSCTTCVRDAESCLALLLTSNLVDVNLQDDNGNTPLHIAVNNQLIKCTEMLISYGADVTIKSDSGEDPVRLMSTKLPETLLYLLDESVFVDQFEPHSEKCVLRVDFRPIVGDDSDSVRPNHSTSAKGISYSSQSTNRIGPNYGREMKLLTSLLDTSQLSENILTHPVVEIFLHLKWKRVRKFFWLSFLCYMLWVLLYSSYVIRVYLLSCPCGLFIRGDGINSTESGSNGFGSSEKCKIETGFSVEVVLIILSTVLLLLMEVGKLLIAPKIYLRSWLNLGNWILIALVFSTSLPTLSAQTSISAFQYQAAAFTVFLAWAYVLTQIGRFPSLAKYVEIFGHVLQCFGSFLLTFASLFVAFSLAFCILFPGNNSPFGNFFYSILKVFVMMIGEVDYQDMFYGESNAEVNNPIIGHILYILFVAIVCIVLMNLFIGLTVSDIQALEKQAEFARVCRLIIEILHLESVIFSKRIPSKIANFLKYYISVCQHQGHGLKDGFTFSFRPNSRGDKSLPQSLKRAAVQIANISFRKSKSQRCSKLQFEENANPMDVPSYFSSPARASSTSSQSSSPLETHSLDVATLGHRSDALVPRPSWTSCSSQR